MQSVNAATHHLRYIKSRLKNLGFEQVFFRFFSLLRLLKVFLKVLVYKKTGHKF